MARPVRIARRSVVFGVLVAASSGAGLLAVSAAVGSPLNSLVVPRGSTMFADAPGFAAMDVAAGPNHSMWFADSKGNSIQTVSADGVTTVFRAASIRHPTGILEASDGAMWFTSSSGVTGSPDGLVGRIAADGSITTYGGGEVDDPEHIIAAPDGDIWFTEYGKVGRITPAGVVTSYPIPHVGGSFAANSGNLVVGPDRHVWFTDYRTSAGRANKGPFSLALIRVDGPGRFSEHVIPDTEVARIGVAARPGSVGVGADHRLWVDGGRHTLDAVTTRGTITRYAGLKIDDPQQLVAGGSGVWVADADRYSIDEVTAHGRISARHRLPGIAPEGLAHGPGSSLWFSNHVRGAVGTVTASGHAKLVAPLIDKPYLVTSGGAGDIWFVNHGNNTLARLTSGSRIETYFGSRITGISDLVWDGTGSMWFTRAGTDEVGRITDSGHVTIVRNKALADPAAIAFGPSADAWVLAGGGTKLVRVTRAGTVKAYSLPSAVRNSAWVVAGTDGDLWVTDGRVGNQAVVLRMSSAGDFTRFTCACDDPGDGVASSRPFIGPDGAIWYMSGFSDREAVRIGPDATISETVLDGAVADTLAVTADGDLHYVTSDYSDGRGRLAMESGPPGGTQTVATAAPVSAAGSLTGHVHLSVLRSAYGHPALIDRGLRIYSDLVPDVHTAAVAPNGHIWFTSAGSLDYTD